MPTSVSNQRLLLGVFTVVFVVGGIAAIALFARPTPQQQPDPQEPVFCTQDAKQCPDGSYVGRTGPKCEFAPCPPIKDDGWDTATGTPAGFTFRYPRELTSTYIHAAEWPPTLQIVSEPFSCTEGSNVFLRTVDNRTYCRLTLSEGAAGSIYTEYAYRFERDGQTMDLRFTLRTVQCANYDDPQKTACENERAAFDPDSLADRIARTITR